MFEASFTSDRSHNAALFGPLEDALKCLPEGTLPAVVIAGTGPGSYSGTRVGIAAAQGVAMVHGCPSVGLSSLAAVPLVSNGSRVLAIGDARRGSVWSAEVRVGELPAEPQLMSAAELEALLAEHPTPEVPIFSLESVERAGLSPETAARVSLEQPDALLLGRAWQALDPESKQALEHLPVQPVYLRPPHITEAKGGHPLVSRQGS